MVSSYAKFCAIMAGAGFSHRELQRLLNELRTVEANKVLDDIQDINKFLSSNYLHYVPNRSVRKDEFPTSDVGARILDLLVHTRNLPRGLVARLLYDSLKAREINRELPSPAKIGFTTWIDRVVRVVPSSELLHVAYAIRDKLDGQTEVDWKLRD